MIGYKIIDITVLSSNCISSGSSSAYFWFYPNTDTNNFVIVTDTNTDTNTGFSAHPYNYVVMYSSYAELLCCRVVVKIFEILCVSAD